MSDTRPELSLRNKYYLPKHRYYELKHFCLQYPVWKSACRVIDGLSKGRDLSDTVVVTSGHSDPTVRDVLRHDYYKSRMNMVESAASQVECSDYILQAVTKGLSYSYMHMNTDIPVSRDVYYSLYRQFFSALNKIRE